MRSAIAKAIDALRTEANAREARATAETREEITERVKELRKLADSLEAQMRDASIFVIFGAGDVEGFAEEAGVPLETAKERAEEWGSAIEQTATELCSGQLLGAIRDGAP